MLFPAQTISFICAFLKRDIKKVCEVIPPVLNMDAVL